MKPRIAHMTFAWAGLEWTTTIQIGADGEACEVLGVSADRVPKALQSCMNLSRVAVNGVLASLPGPGMAALHRFLEIMDHSGAAIALVKAILVAQTPSEKQHRTVAEAQHNVTFLARAER